MILIGYALWIGFAVFLSLRLANAGGERSRLRNILAVVLWIVLVLLPYWDVILTMPAMRQLCDEKAGFQRYEAIDVPLQSVAVNSDSPTGACLSCYVLLIRGLTTEAQAEIRGSHPRDRGLTDEPGIMRYRLAPVGDTDCRAFEIAFASEKEKRDLWDLADVAYDPSRCIAAARSDSITAAYELTYPLFENARDGLLHTGERGVELRRAGSHALVASLKFVQQDPWTRRTLYYPLPPVPSCPSVSGRAALNRLTPESLLELLAGRLQEKQVFERREERWK